MVTTLHRRRPRQGYILAVTLVTCFLVVFLLLHAGVQTEHLQLARTIEHQTRNGNAAHSLHQLAIDRLMYDPQWREGFDYRTLGLPGVNASLTFDPQHSFHSTNNHANEVAATSWDDKIVPPGFVNLTVTSLSPDATPDNPLDNDLSVQTVRQMMVNVYRRFFLEDFNDNGQTGVARNAWTFSPAQEGRIIGTYAYLGVGASDSDTSFAMAGKDWWRDYDLEAVVAYYGYGGFGLLVRASGKRAYGVAISPVHACDRLVGAAVQPCLLEGPRDWRFLPQVERMQDKLMVDQGSEGNNPFITAPPARYVLVQDESRKIPERHSPFALWRIRVSVENKDLHDTPHRVLQVRVTRLDPSVGAAPSSRFTEGPTWVSPEIEQPAGGPEHGRIGLFCQNKTAIGFTHVIVNKRGRAMVRIPAVWTTR